LAYFSCFILNTLGCRAFAAFQCCALLARHAAAMEGNMRLLFAVLIFVAIGAEIAQAQRIQCTSGRTVGGTVVTTCR
jgi:hypothetical protein